MSQDEKIMLIQDIAEMLNDDADDQLLQSLQIAAVATDQHYPGSIEAYQAADQLRILFEQGSDSYPYCS